ncbi:MAG TPA: hypothetical protein VGX75_10835 [bacterium]|nr:hypothetical protein [bacterium]
MSARASSRRQSAADPRDAVRRRWGYDVSQRCAAVVRASGMRRPPFSPERYAAKCGVAGIIAGAPEEGQVRVEHRTTADGRAQRTMIVVDRRLPPHTPQWNGAVALGLGEMMLPPGAAGEARRALAEAAAADLLLPAAVFRPAAARTDLTMDGLRDLSARFAAPLRLTARQWLSVGLWRGFALLWRELDGALRIGWRASSSGRFPPALALGTDAAAVWTPDSRLFATHRTGLAHHGVEEVRTGGGTAWWFTRFAAVRDGVAEGGGAARPAVFAMVMLASGGPRRTPGRPRPATM